MKKILFISLFLCTLLFSACQKEPTPSNTPANDYYITFDFDGSPIEYRSTGYQCNTSNGFTSGGIWEPNLNNFSTSESIYVDLMMDPIFKIKKNDLQTLINQKLKVCLSSFSSAACDSDNHANLRFEDGTNEWVTDRVNNTYPTNYLEVTSVSSSNSTVLGFDELVIVEGRFNLVLHERSTNVRKNASNGQFRLQFAVYD